MKLYPAHGITSYHADGLTSQAADGSTSHVYKQRENTPNNTAPLHTQVIICVSFQGMHIIKT
jgi:N-acetylmuramoyl-L-alanine amidase